MSFWFGVVGYAYGADYFLDVNGSLAGSGIANGGIYGVSGNYWTTSSAGTGTPRAYVSRNNVNFSAGTDAYGMNYTVTGDLVEPSSTMTVQEGYITLSAIWSAWGLNSIRTLDGSSLNITGAANDFYSKVIDFDVQGNSSVTLNSISTTSGRTGGVAKNGTGLLTITGAASARGITVNVNSGDLRIAHGNALFTSGYGATVTVNGGSLQLSNNITVANNPVTLSGYGFNNSGALRNVANTNSYASTINLAGDARINADTNTQLTLNPSATNAVNGAFGLALGGDGTISVTRPIADLAWLVKDGNGTVAISSNGTFAGPTVINSGTLRLLNAMLAGDITNNALLVVSNSAVQNLASRVAGSGQIIKQSVGRLTLTATNGFSGAVYINGGTLALAANGSMAQAAFIAPTNGAVFDVSAVAGFTLNPGQTLGGSGVVTGAVVAVPGAHFSPGLPGAPGTLSFSNALTQTGGVTNTFDLSTATNGANDQMIVGGNFVFSGQNFVRINYTTLTNGTYKLIRTLAGTVVGNVSSLQLLGLIPGMQVVTLVTNVTGTEINLVVAPSSHLPAELIWTGNGGNNRWDETNSLTWRSNSVASVFFQADRVTFDDAGASNPVVNLFGQLAPGAVTVNASSNYLFAGSGALIGPVALVKTNSGWLAISTTNSFSGGTLVAGGTLQISNAAALGSGAVTNNGALAFASASTLIFSNSVSGNGSLTHVAGPLVLAGSNSFSGTCTVNAGTLQVGNPAALGTPGGATIVAAGAVLDLNGQAIGAESVVLSGGTLSNAAPPSASLAGAVNVVSNSIIAGAGDFSLSGGLSGSGALNKAGTHSLTLSGTSSLTGPINIAAGKLVVTGTTGPGAITIGSGAVLDGGGVIRGPVTNLPGGTIALGTNFTRLTVSNALTLANGSTTILKVGRAGTTPTNDVITGVTTLNRAGKLVIQLAGNPVQNGDAFQLFLAAGGSGSFSLVELPWLSGGLVWDTSDLANGIVRAVLLPDVSTFAQRRAWTIQQAAENPGAVNDDFVQAQVYFSLGQVALGQAAALAASRTLTNNVQVDFFNLWPAMDCYLRFNQFLDAETKANIKTNVVTCTQYAGTTTSNLKTLGHVIRYLGSEAFGEAAFAANAVWRTNDPNAYNSLLSLLSSVAKNGFGEHGSRPYYDKNLLPILSLAQLATNPVIATRAMLAFQGGLSQNAGCWMRGHLGINTSRSYPDMETQTPMGSLRTLWLYFGGEAPPQNYTYAALAAVMNYEPLPVIQMAATNRATPYVSRGGYFGAQQNSYVDRDYVLFSEGPEYYGNFQVYPSGAMWCDPDDNHFSQFWLCAPWNDDPGVVSGSWPHGMNRAIYSEAQCRDSVLQIYNFDPNDTNRPPYALGYVPGGWRAVVNDAMTSGKIFLHYGTMMLAISAEQTFKWDTNSGIYAVSQSPTRPGDSEFRIWGAPIPASMQTIPKLANTYLGTWNSQFAMAMETARPDWYPGATPADQLAAFRADIYARTGLNHAPGYPPTGFYTNRHGETLQVKQTSALTPPPIVINGQTLSLTNWPLTDNPWIYQSVGGNLSLYDGTNTIVYDFAAWTIATNNSILPPVGLLASTNSTGVFLNWSPRAGTTSYTVKRGIVSGGPYTAVGTTANHSFLDATATGGGYYYIVTASNSFGESAPSNEAYVLVPPRAPAILGTSYTNGQMGFIVGSADFYRCVVQASTNLAQWVGVFTNPPGAPPVWWSDPATGFFDRRFYRFQLVP